MNGLMKNSIQKRIGKLENPEVEDIRPDISAQVETVCCKFNSSIIRLKEVLRSIKNDKFDKSMLNEEGQDALIDILDSIENKVIGLRKAFEEFYDHYNQLVGAGCRVSSWAKTCLKNANSASLDMSKNFGLEREKIMGSFYDSLPSNVRLGKSPVFGGKNSPNISKYIATLIS